MESKQGSEKGQVQMPSYPEPTPAWTLHVPEHSLFLVAEGSLGQRRRERAP